MTTIKYKMGGAWFDLLPNPLPGFIYPFGGGTVPQGFLLCDGQAVSRTTYAELFAVIGTIYGSGDGSTTFNVPDFRGRVGIGASSGHTLGSTGGKESVDLSAAIGSPTGDPSYINFIAEGATVYQQNHSGSYQVGGNVKTTNPGFSHSTPVTEASSSSRSTTIMQPYNTINYIISTGQNTGVSVEDIITGVTTLPLAMEYGGTGGTVHKIADDYYLYAPKNGAGGLVIKNGVAYNATIVWSANVPSITLKEPLTQIETNKNNITTINTTLSNARYVELGRGYYSSWTHIATKDDSTYSAYILCTMYRAGKNNTAYNRFLSTITVPGFLLNADNTTIPIGDSGTVAYYVPSGTNNIYALCGSEYCYALVIGCRW